MGRQMDREPAELEHFRVMLQAYMDQKGLRSTDQRRLIVETFFHADNHVSIEELLAQVRAKDPRVGLRDRLPDAQAPHRVRRRQRAPLRRRPHALRARRRRVPPRSPHLRRVRRHHRVRGAAHRGAPGEGREEVRLRAAIAQARALRRVREVPERAPHERQLKRAAMTSACQHADRLSVRRAARARR